jgi:competence protein ComEA
MLERLGRYQFAILALAVLLFAAALLTASLQDGASTPVGFESSDRLPDGTPIKVYVTGAVAMPGVYELQAGDRVSDALDVAGGATAAADPGTINLARRLRDGEQITVPAKANRSSTTAALLAPGEPVNVNTATEAQLDALPGIGEAYSRRIIDSRTVDGPFNSLDELVTRKALPAATLEKIRDQLSVGP